MSSAGSPSGQKVFRASEPSPDKHKLFEIELTSTVLVYAKDRAAALKVALNDIDRNDMGEWGFDHVKQLQTLKDLPSDWYDCYPFMSCADEFAAEERLTCDEILQDLDDERKRAEEREKARAEWVAAHPALPFDGGDAHA